MRKLLLLLLGLLLIIILTYFCFQGKALGIKNDLISKTQALYIDKGLTDINVTVKGENLEQTRILTLKGTVATVEDKMEASKIAEYIDGVQGVDNQLRIVVSIPSPYTIKAIKSKDGKVILSGYVGNTTVHESLVKDAKGIFGAENVIDELKEIEGSPLAWYESSKLGLEQLNVVEYGNFNISDKDFTFEGYVSNRNKKEQLLTGFKRNLNGEYNGVYNVESPKVVIPSPYTIKAIKSKDGKVILSGYVGNTTVHESLVKDAKGIFGVENVIDELKEIEGSPLAWYESSKLGLEQLNVVEYGNFNISDKDFTFEGYVSEVSKKESLKEGLQSSLNTSYTGSYNISAPEVKVETVMVTCQMQFKNILSEQKIHFAYNKANIKKSSYDLLNKLLAVSKNCPNQTIVIEGHTDSDGSETYNQKLSAKRANAVKKYFITNGMDTTKVEAVGYGELYPIVDNGTKAGKEKNRRIEINLKGVK